MKLIIDIDENDYKWIKNHVNTINEQRIANGIPLPKGHGRLIDADALDIPVDICDGFEAMDYIDGADTIIEADKESEVNNE